MQVQKVTNSNITPSFQGKIDIIPGDLSYEPVKYLRKAYTSMEMLIKDKPYNLYIRQNHRENTVSVIAQNEKDFLKNRGVRTVAVVPASADLYKEAALGAAYAYEDLAHNASQSFWGKIKKHFCKIEFKFKLNNKGNK